MTKLEKVLINSSHGYLSGKGVIFNGVTYDTLVEDMAKSIEKEFPCLKEVNKETELTNK